MWSLDGFYINLGPMLNEKRFITLFCYLTVCFAPVTPSYGHDAGVLEFNPAPPIKESEHSPRCSVRRNTDRINELIAEMEGRGYVDVQINDDASLCGEIENREGDYEPNCVNVHGEKLWVLDNGTRQLLEFATQVEAFAEAAYQHAEGTCIFPFHFSMTPQRK